MPNFRRFLTRRWLIALAAVPAVYFGLLMLHPYPRQALFGPTIRGKPWCFWDAEVRAYVQRSNHAPLLTDQVWRSLGSKQEHMTATELFDDAEMLPLLLELADDENAEVRKVALRALGMFRKLDAQSSLAFLQKRLHDKDLDTRLVAGWTIWQINRDRQVIPVILRDLYDLGERQHNGCLVTIWIRSHQFPGSGMMFQEPGDMHELLPIVAFHASDPDARIRASVMRAMRDFGKNGLAILTAGLKDDDAEVRSLAAGSLKALGPIAAATVPALELRLGDADQEVRAAVTEALQTLDPQRFGHLKAERKIE